MERQHYNVWDYLSSGASKHINTSYNIQRSGLQFPLDELFCKSCRHIKDR